MARALQIIGIIASILASNTFWKLMRNLFKFLIDMKQHNSQFKTASDELERQRYVLETIKDQIRTQFSSLTYSQIMTLQEKAKNLKKRIQELENLLE